MAEASAEEHADPRLLTALVAVAAFMGSLDASIVNVSLPHLAEEFGTTLSAVRLGRPRLPDRPRLDPDPLRRAC